MADDTEPGFAGRYLNSRIRESDGLQKGFAGKFLNDKLAADTAKNIPVKIDPRDNFKAKVSPPTSLTFPTEIRGSGSFPMIVISAVEYPTFAPIYDANGNFTGVNNITKDASKITFNGIDDPQNFTTLATIVLAMPQNIQDSQGLEWSMENNPLIQSIEQYAATEGPWDNGLKQLGTNSVVAVVGDVVRPFSGITANPKKQAIFKAPEIRAFAFDFIFTPTSADECTTIEKIIKTLKQHSLPKRSASGSYLLFPALYRIRFENVRGFPKIYASALMNISTNYTPNTLQLLRSGHSIQITMSLAFQEITLRTHEQPGV